jgi:IS30 family transposase
MDIRRSMHSGAGGQSRGQIVDAISISERPAEIEDRASRSSGGDLLSGTGNGHIVTLVAPHYTARYLLIAYKCEAQLRCMRISTRLGWPWTFARGAKRAEDF